MFLICAFLLIATPLSALDYYEEGLHLAKELQKSNSPSPVEKESLKQQVALVKIGNQDREVEIAIGKANKKCLVALPSVENIQTSLYVFVSFSLPEETWLTLSQEVTKVGGVLVLRGLPNNSFKQLAHKVHALREKGVLAPVQIDPKLFSKFAVTKIPCFVTTYKEDFDKLTGNVSLKFALEKMENENAKMMGKLL
jgi:type-F conjugative transfer system pilin assembly protein TrbC